MKKSALVLLVLLAACGKQPGQNQYNYAEVGQSVVVEFATVVSAKEIGITGPNTGGGALAGAVVGGGAGSYGGGGTGSVWSTAGGVVAGGIAGAAAEQMMADSKGYEYVIVTENKKTKTIAQNQNPEDKVFKPGERVMLQTKGTYQRLLSADNLPEEIKKPKGINIID